MVHKPRRRGRPRKVKNKQPPQKLPQPVSNEELEAMVRDDHELMIIKNNIDWKPLEEIVADLYDDKRGRPIANFPIIMFRATLLKHIKGLSDRDITDQIQFNLLYRKFIGYTPTEKIFEFSALSKFRKRLADASLDKKLFAEVNRQLVELGMIKPNQTIFVDGTTVSSRVNRATINQFLTDNIRLIIKAMEIADPGPLARLREKYGDMFDRHAADRQSTAAFMDSLNRTATFETLVVESLELLCFLEDEQVSQQVRDLANLLGLTLERNVIIEDIRDPTWHHSKRYGKRTPATAPPEAEPTAEKYSMAATETGVKSKNMSGPISPLDPEATYGRGTGGKKVSGWKPEIMVNEDRFVTAIRVGTASDSDGKPENILTMIDEMADYGLNPETIVGDSAYGGNRLISTLAEPRWDVEMVAKPQLQLSSLEGDIFEIDRDAMTARCMAGHMVSLKSPKRLRAYLQANFPIKACIGCPFWDACGGEPLRRIRRVLFPIAGGIANLLWDMAMENSRVLDLLRQRSGMVEPHFNQFKGIGMARARFVGRRKVELDWTLTAAGLNLRRMARLLKAAA